VGTIVNLTKYTATHAVDVGIDGRWHVTVTVKAAFSWDKDGHAIPAETPPFAESMSSLASRRHRDCFARPKWDPRKQRSMCFSLVHRVSQARHRGGCRAGRWHAPTQARSRIRDRVWLPGMLGTFAAVCEDLP